MYKGGPIDHVTHVQGPVSQYSAESEYDSACIAGMDLAHFRMVIHEFLNKDPDIVPEEASLIILDSNSAKCMANKGKYTKRTRHILRRVNFVRNGENCKIHKIDWCKLGIQLEDIDTNNVCEHYLNPIMKYNMVRHDN